MPGFGVYSRKWCNAFTRKELILTIVEAVLLALLILFLIYVTLHMLACSMNNELLSTQNATPPTPEQHYTGPAWSVNYRGCNNNNAKDSNNNSPSDDDKSATDDNKSTADGDTFTKGYTEEQSLSNESSNEDSESNENSGSASNESTENKNDNLSTENKTDNLSTENKTDNLSTENCNNDSLRNLPVTTTLQPDTTLQPYDATTLQPDTKNTTDCDKCLKAIDDHKKGICVWDSCCDRDSPWNLPGKEDGLAFSSQRELVLALVMSDRGESISCRCVVTIIAPHWGLTAASCIQEEDELEYYALIQDYGESIAGNMIGITEVYKHPQHLGRRQFDIMALHTDTRLTCHPTANTKPHSRRRHKRQNDINLRLFIPQQEKGTSSEEDWLEGKSDQSETSGTGSTSEESGLEEEKERPRIKCGKAAKLATEADHANVDVGHTFVAVGYKHFRQTSHIDMRLRQAFITALSLKKCIDPRTPPRSMRARATPEKDATPLCAGVRDNSSIPCYFCTGTPLFMNQTLYAIMSEPEACGFDCRAQLYVETETIITWIQSVIENYNT